MNARHRRTLAAIFAKPTLASIVFADIEALIKALGGTVSEREGRASELNWMVISGGVIGHTRAKRRRGIRWKKRESF